MQLLPQLINEEVSSLFCLVEFIFGFIKRILEFSDFLDADILHFFIVLF